MPSSYQNSWVFHPLARLWYKGNCGNAHAIISSLVYSLYGGAVLSRTVMPREVLLLVSLLPAEFGSMIPNLALIRSYQG